MIPPRLANYQTRYQRMNQGVTGACCWCAATAGMQWVSLIIQNNPLPNLSWGFAYCVDRPDDTFKYGGDDIWACDSLWGQPGIGLQYGTPGVCAEEYYTQLTVLSNWQGGGAYPPGALPNAAARANALNYKILKHSVVAQRNPNMEYVFAILDAGYPILYSRHNHAVVLVDRDKDRRLILALNSRMADTDNGYGLGVEVFPEDTIADQYGYDLVAIQQVQNADIITVPPPSGNTQMLIDTIKQDANALVLGQITDAQVAKIKADVSQLVADAGTAFPTILLVNGTFELPGVSTFQYNPPTSPTIAWVFAGGSGVSKNGTGFTGGNPPAPSGSQVAFMQGTSAKITQTLSLPAGNYTLALKAAQRKDGQSGTQVLKLKIDTAVVGQYQPPGTTYTDYTTAAVALTAGTHTIELSGAGSGSDFTAFVDNVVLAKV